MVPTYAPSATAPTINHATPTPLPQLANHCAETGNTYWLHVETGRNVRDLAASITIDKETLSPTGEFTAYQTNRGLFVGQSGVSEVVQLVPRVTYDYFPEFVWSPFGGHLAFMLYEKNRLLGIYVYDFSRGLANPTEIVLPPEDVGNYSAIGPWSPDSEYLVLSNYELAADIWSVWSFGQREIVYTGELGTLANTWSPDSQWLTYLGPEYNESRLGIANVETGTAVSFEIGDTPSLSNLYSSTLFWSPNSQYLVTVNKTSQISVFSIDGRRWLLGSVSDILNAATIVSGARWTIPIFWSPDGQALFYWIQDANLGYVLYRWTPQSSPDDAAIRVFEASSRLLFGHGQYLPQNPLAYAESGTFLALDGTMKPLMEDRIAMLSGSGEIEFMHPDGSESEVWIQGLSTLYDLRWSSDDRAVGAIWSSDNGVERHVYLTWINSAGDFQIELEEDILAVNYFDWGPENKVLVVHVQRSSGETVMLVDAIAGTRTTLLRDVQGTSSPSFYSPDGFYTLLWSSSAGQNGYDGYNADGTRAFRVNLLLSTYERLFFSPDKQWVVTKGWQSGEYLALVRTDGSPAQSVLSGLNGLGNPIWSPDGEMFAFTHSVAGSGTVLNLASIEGETLWSAPFTYPLNEVTLTWEQCP
jgi:Tol biopolymer transport system component